MMKTVFSIFVLAIVIGCSTTPVSNVKLYSKKSGFDVTCSEGIEECYQYADTQCGGKYRIHHSFEDDVLLETHMRFECLSDKSSQKACGEVGVNCVLSSSFL